MGTNREPICGHCWARGVRQALDFKLDGGYWECPLCLARSVTPGPDEQELRKRWQEMVADYRPVNALMATDPEKTIRSTLRLRPGRGTKSKRRRSKKPVPRPWFPVDPKR